MNIVDTFHLKYQGKIIKIDIEKIAKNKFIGHCKLQILNRSIDYNQAGTTPENVKEKMKDFFTDEKSTPSYSIKPLNARGF